MSNTKFTISLVSFKIVPSGGELPNLLPSIMMEIS